jgi:NADPH:quinone reductase-like Zn-dependent oxidoreductase
VGGRASDELMDLVADEGWLISFGALSGRPMQLSPDNLLFKRALVKGFWAAKPSKIVTPEQMRGAIGDLVRRAATGMLKLPVAEVFDLDHAAEAASAHNAAGRPGKIALRG